MKNKDKSDSIRNKLAIFEAGARKSAKIDLSKKDNPINKLFQIYQPQKINEINNKKSNINDLKKNEKRDSNNHLKTEIEKSKENYSKINVSNNFNYTGRENIKNQNQNVFDSIKKNDKKISPPKKKEEVPVNKTFNYNVSEMIKKLNQNEEKNKFVQTGNKGIIKSNETVNKYSNNNNKINEQKNKNISHIDKKINEEKGKITHNNDKIMNENQNKIIHNNNNNFNLKNKENNINNTSSNRSKNNNLNQNNTKDIKQIEKNNSPKRNKFLENILLFSKNAKDKEDKDNTKNYNYEKNDKKENIAKNSASINSDYKKLNSTNFKDKIKNFENSENNIKNNGIVNSNNKEKPKKLEINNQEKNGKENISNIINKRNSAAYELKTEKKNYIPNLMVKISNKPPNNICKEKEKEKKEKEEKEKIIKNESPKNITQIQVEKSNSKRISQVKVDTEISEKNKENLNKNQNNYKNLKIKEEIKEVSIQMDNSDDKRSKSTVKKGHSQNLNNNNDKNKEFEILEKITINSEFQTNSFCKAFFIASIPQKEPKIIENSENIKAFCGQNLCSSLPSFQPEIIYKYPQKDSQTLEINNILASICYPNSIKVCFCDKEDKIYTPKNSKSCFTNQVGDRFYSMMYYLYVRMTNKDFCFKYGSDLFAKLTMECSSEVSMEVEKNINSIHEINSRKYVYVPYCLSLVSKFPFFPQMEKCLESIMETLKNSDLKGNELNEIITFLVRSIPAPYVNTSVFFPVPNCSDIIELIPCFNQEMPINGDNPISLLDNLKVNNIVLLFRLLLFEQKILLISNDYDKLTQVSLNLISLLYPLSWVHIYIPIITENMLKYLESFLPFFNGMHKSLYQKQKVKNLLHQSQKDLFIFDIDKNKFEISCNLFAKKKINPIKFLNRQIPPLPKNIEVIIGPQLNVLKSYYRNHSTANDYMKNHIKSKTLFIQVFMELLYDYKKYLSFIDDLPVFNTNEFLHKRPENDKIFFKELTTTQLFQIFIQNALSYINNKDKKYFFDELIEKYFKVRGFDRKNNLLFLILNTEFDNYLEEHLFTIKKNYFINPSHLKLFQPIINKINIQKGRKLMQDITDFLKQEFKDRYLLNEKGIIKENKRIIYNDINLSHENDINDFGYYMTQEEAKEENLRKHQKKEKKIKFEEFQENITNNKTNCVQKNANKISKPKLEEDNLSTLEKEDIRDNIRETLTRVFKSEKVNVNKDSSLLLSSIKKNYGVNYFVDIIGQNKNSKEIKLISGDSFEILFLVINKLLLRLKVSERDTIYSIKLLKSSCYFKAIVNKVEYILFDKLIEILTKNYKLYNEIHFWDLWIEEELSTIDKEILNKFRKIVEDKNAYHYIEENDEQIGSFKINYINEMKRAKKYMIKMKLNKSFILSVIVELINKYFKDDKEFEEFKTEVVIEMRAIN